jgi:hypothetical protein
LIGQEYRDSPKKCAALICPVPADRRPVGSGWDGATILMRKSSVATRHAPTGRIACFMSSFGRREQCLLAAQIAEAPRPQEVATRVGESDCLQLVDDVPPEVLEAQDSPSGFKGSP